MTTSLRVAAFVLVLIAVFAVALGLGRWVGPLATEPTAHADDTGHGDGHEATEETAPAAAVAGLETSRSGYTLVLTESRLAAGRQHFEFTITGPDGSPLTAYDKRHERDLHLIAVRRDLTGFQHVHPTLDPSTGTWSTELAVAAGSWRVLADFAPEGKDPLVLGTDLLVSGQFAPGPLGEDVRVATVGPYQVVLNGDLAQGESRLDLQVSRGGTPVTDLQPYLGAYGHLVAMRAGDLGYLHVHPDGEPGSTPAGPDIAFHTEFPSDGRYRLFLDFRHGGVVRTAAFTVTVGEGGHGHDDHDHGNDARSDEESAEGGESGHDH
ncbi:MAG: hypothetical protein ACRDOM_06345 [Nocardioides sp.]